MGFGGKLTVGGCKVGARIGCRRRSSSASPTCAGRIAGAASCSTPKGDVVEWLYQAPGEFDSAEEPMPASDAAGSAEAIRLHDAADRGGRAEAEGRRHGAARRHRLHRPRRGPQVPAQGRRTATSFKDGVIYHCGPVVLKRGGEYRVVAAGPTTSIREEPYQADIIKRFGDQGGDRQGRHGCEDTEGMPGTRLRLPARHRRRGTDLRAMRQARSDVYLEQFGSPEAVWELE